MDSKDVVKMSNSFLDLITKITEPEQLLFRTFSYSDKHAHGLFQLCQKAKKLCKGNATDSIASLTICENNTNSFEIKGSHAIASFAVQQTYEIKLLILVLVIVAIIIFCFTLRKQ